MQRFAILRTEKMEHRLEVAANNQEQALAKASVGPLDHVVKKEGVEHHGGGGTSSVKIVGEYHDVIVRVNLETALFVPAGSNMNDAICDLEIPESDDVKYVVDSVELISIDGEPPA